MILIIKYINYKYHDSIPSKKQPSPFPPPKPPNSDQNPQTKKQYPFPSNCYKPLAPGVYLDVKVWSGFYFTAGLFQTRQLDDSFGFSSNTLRVLSGHSTVLLRVSFETDSGILPGFFGSSSTFFDILRHFFGTYRTTPEEHPKKGRTKGV